MCNTPMRKNIVMILRQLPGSYKLELITYKSSFATKTYVNCYKTIDRVYKIIHIRSFFLIDPLKMKNNMFFFIYVLFVTCLVNSGRCADLRELDEGKNIVNCIIISDYINFFFFLFSTHAKYR